MSTPGKDWSKLCFLFMVQHNCILISLLYPCWRICYSQRNSEDYCYSKCLLSHYMLLFITHFSKLWVMYFSNWSSLIVTIKYHGKFPVNSRLKDIRRHRRPPKTNYCTPRGKSLHNLFVYYKKHSKQLQSWRIFIQLSLEVLYVVINVYPYFPLYFYFQNKALANMS